MRPVTKSWWLSALAAAGLVIPAPALAGEKAEAPAKPARPAAEATPRVRDVALAKDGSFNGRVVDGQGQPLDGVVVKLLKGEQTVGETTADTDGRFKFTALKGGVYQVQTPQSQAVYRLWSADVAPAQSMKTVVMTGASPVVRGQLGFVDPATLAALGLGIAGVSLAGVAVHKLNKLEDDVNDIPTSP